MATLEERRASAFTPPQCGHLRDKSSVREESPAHVSQSKILFLPTCPGVLPMGQGRAVGRGPCGAWGPRLAQPQAPHPLTRPWGLQGKYLRVTLRADAHNHGDRSRPPAQTRAQRPPATVLGGLRALGLRSLEAPGGVPG